MRQPRSLTRAIGLLFCYLATLLFAALVFLILVILALTHGPSSEARNLFVLSCEETSALKFLPRLFLAGDTVDAILGGAGTSDPAPLDPEASEPVSELFVELGYDPADLEGLSGTDAEMIAKSGVPADVPAADRTADVTVEEVNEGSYRGMMMLIPDPSRVVIGTLPHYSEGASGKLLTKFIEDYGAIGGTNAGGFEDLDGRGAGGCPTGLVIENGVLRYGEEDRTYQNVIGFSADGTLLLGNWTPRQAVDAGVSSAICFEEGWVLVKDGVAAQSQSSGINPRTAIGQRADGTILLLVIEGRHAGSLGATADDLRDIFVRYDAVNAASLDGGTSSVMFFEGEQITRGSNLLGMRALPDAILVMPAGDEAEQGGAAEVADR